MPFDKEKLQETLIKMRKIYFKNPEKATKSQKFISLLHDYCESELKQRDISDYYVHKEKIVSGSNSEKKVDLVVIGSQDGSRSVITGPLITISVKSQMSSIGKNFLTVYDRIVGEVLNIHNRFPLAVANCIYLYPIRGYNKPSKVQHKEAYERIKQAIHKDELTNPEDYLKEQIRFDVLNRKYGLITGREGTASFNDKHEHFCLLVIDFDKEIPDIRNDLVTHKDLSIDNFFDKIVRDYKERNASFLS